MTVFPGFERVAMMRELVRELNSLATEYGNGNLKYGIADYIYTEI